ncbi:MAG: type II toxin-antitoxin system VapB family antitoxin [Desulfobacterales bacterium]|nr:type II toxin-antitoxin system VapB family antitoxin [Desulfobacterales bacterium]
MQIVHQLAHEKGCTQTEVIREALKNYTQNISHPKPKGIGRFHSGRSDVSEKAEELMYKSAGKKEKNVINR